MIIDSIIARKSRKNGICTRFIVNMQAYRRLQALWGKYCMTLLDFLSQHLFFLIAVVSLCAKELLRWNTALIIVAVLSVVPTGEHFQKSIYNSSCCQSA